MTKKNKNKKKMQNWKEKKKKKRDFTRGKLHAVHLCEESRQEAKACMPP